MKFASLSGSLTQLSDGTSYLVAGNNVAITTQSNGQITISAAGGTPTTQWTDLGNTLVTTSSVGVGTSSSLTSVGSDVFFYVSGSRNASGSEDKKAVFEGDVAVSGSALLFGGVAFNVLSCSSGPGSVYYVSASTTVVVLDHGTVTAALPLNAPIGTFFIFKDGAGDASSGPKYISASLGSIDGSATTTLPSSSYSSIMVVKIGETDKWIKHS